MGNYSFNYYYEKVRGDCSFVEIDCSEEDSKILIRAC